MRLSQNQVIVLLLAFFVGLILISHFYYFYGHFGVDDMVYSRMANDLLTGHTDWQDHYSYRWTITGFTALSYWIFGINDHSSALPTLLLSIGVIFLLMKSLKGRPWYEGCLVLGFYFMYQWNLFYADKLMPDIYVSAFLLMAWYTYQQLPNVKREVTWHPLIFTLGLLMAFLAKGTVILILPLLGYYFIRDMVLRSNLKFWKVTVLLHVVIYPLYFLLIYSKTGSLLGRFNAISENSYFNSCSYDALPFADTIERWTSGFFNLITNELLYIHLLILIAAILTSLFSDSKISRESIYTSAICFASANFMTISLTSYNPMCLDPRHFLLFTPILALCSIDLLRGINGSRVGRISLAVLCVCSLLFIEENLEQQLLVGGIGLLSFGRLFFQRYTWIPYLTVTLLCLWPSYQYMKYSKSLKYDGFKTEFEEYLNDQQQPITVYGSHVMNNLGEYYLAYDTTVVKFRNVRQSNFKSSQSEQNILVKNWYCDWHSDVKELTYQDWLKNENVVASPVDSTSVFLSIYSLQK